MMIALTPTQRAMAEALLIEWWRLSVPSPAEDPYDQRVHAFHTQRLDPWVIHEAPTCSLLRRLATTVYETAQCDTDLSLAERWLWPLLQLAFEVPCPDHPLMDPWYEGGEQPPEPTAEDRQRWAARQ